MVIIETSVFTRRITELLSEEEYRELQATLVEHPKAGPVVPGSGCVRKLRWSASGRGKRGGARVIYYWATEQDHLLMLFIYAKNESEDLTRDQIKILRQLVEREYP